VPLPWCTSKSTTATRLRLCALQRIFGRHRHVVEEAKAHGLVAAGMVARRAHGAKGVFELAGHHRVGGGHGRTGRAQRGIPGVGVDGRVGVDLRWRGPPASISSRSQSVRPRSAATCAAGVRQLDVGQGRFRGFARSSASATPVISSRSSMASSRSGHSGWPGPSRASGNRVGEITRLAHSFVSPSSLRRFFG
jgi:hypothetical protein